LSRCNNFQQIFIAKAIFKVLGYYYYHCCCCCCVARTLKRLSVMSGTK